MSVLIETTVGDLVFDLYTDERPRSSLNFLKLCKIKYYNYCLFHSVRRNFIAQCGDPTGTGRGGESIYSYIYGDQAKYFDLETKPRIKHKTKGTISFVNNGNDKHGSQFFITMGEGLDFLDGKHTIFGMLAEGFDTLEKLNETICDDNHKPYQDVRITHTIILYDPYDDPRGLEIPEGSPEPTKEQLESCRIGADEDIDDEKNKPKEEIRKQIEEKELQIGTKILETVGDIPDTEEKPPENVLFVCKLNPITNAEDLKIIFSRFGKIRSCEIIKDYKTGDSLCYGFVEFKEVEACEKAYFKMDNVLIDDRRIHVDFCQSIAKVKKWHKSSAYQKNLKDSPVTENYELKSNKMKNKDKYSMVFEEEAIVSTKPKKKLSRDSLKEKSKKRYDSDTEDETPAVKRLSETKPKRAIKESRKRKNSLSSASESEDEPPREMKPKKRPDIGSKEKADLKKKVRKEKLPDSDLSSDEHEYSKRERKKRYDDKKIDHKGEEMKNKKKSQKKERRSRNSESDEEVEKGSIYKSKKKKKVEEYYSDSDDLDSNINAKKSKKEKYLDKKKRKTHESDEEADGRNPRDGKQRSHSKKSSSNKSRARSIEDSDTEDYADSNEKESFTRKKHTRVSSNESSDDGRKSKVSRSTRPESSDDERKKKSHKKLQNKKKSRKRHDSSESDSSEYS